MPKTTAFLTSHPSMALRAAVVPDDFWRKSSRWRWQSIVSHFFARDGGHTAASVTSEAGASSSASSTSAASAATGPTDKELLRLAEDYHTSWNSHELRSRAAAWLYSKVDEMSGVRAEGRAVEQVVDWNSQPPQKFADWYGGHVDITVANRGDVDVELWREKWPTPPLADEQVHQYQGDETQTFHWRLAPGTGHRFVSHEGEAWSVRIGAGRRKRVLKQWTVDIANGILQDISIGVPELCTPGTGSECAAAAGA